jgi:hypothetical protein
MKKERSGRTGPEDLRRHAATKKKRNKGNENKGLHIRTDSCIIAGLGRRRSTARTPASVAHRAESSISSLELASLPTGLTVEKVGICPRFSTPFPRSVSLCVRTHAARPGRSTSTTRRPCPCSVASGGASAGTRYVL